MYPVRRELHFNIRYNNCCSYSHFHCYTHPHPPSIYPPTPPTPPNAPPILNPLSREERSYALCRYNLLTIQSSRQTHKKNIAAHSKAAQVQIQIRKRREKESNGRVQHSTNANPRDPENAQRRNPINAQRTQADPTRPLSTLP